MNTQPNLVDSTNNIELVFSIGKEVFELKINDSGISLTIGKEVLKFKVQLPRKWLPFSALVIIISQYPSLFQAIEIAKKILAP